MAIIAGTTILVPYHPCQVAETYLQIEYPYMNISVSTSSISVVLITGRLWDMPILP